MLLTVAKIKSAIKRMDAAIAAAEVHAPHLNGDDWHSFMALKKRRHALHMLLLARRVECAKKVVSLHRWRYGFDTGDIPEITLDITQAMG